MKKAIAALLIAVLALGTAAGCASKGPLEEEQTESSQESTAPESAPSPPASAPEASSAPEPEPEPEPAPEPQPAPQPQSADAVILPYLHQEEISGFGGERNGRVGTAAELDAVRAYLAGLSADSVTALSAEAMPNNYDTPYTLSAGELAEIVGMLARLEPDLLPEEELGNPYTGGGWTIYIEAPQGRLELSYTGWFTVSYPDAPDVQIFRAEQSDPFLALNEYIRTKIEGVN